MDELIKNYEFQRKKYIKGLPEILNEFNIVDNLCAITKVVLSLVK